ncbi:OmpA family protein [Metabacillus bambusae]|uniref:OmpA family protein n=1 Tax=Metabacillus bambusae TaxID=2795218 RepID=A0ABS3N8B4_9BACI|nr:OmpA family protein [Metabacillus bambusae]MBO1514531.1 OmpA family protein [Metabacillus bambusae]
MKRYSIVIIATAIFLSGCGNREATITALEPGNQTLKKLEQGEPVMEGQVVEPNSEVQSTNMPNLNIDLPDWAKVIKVENAIIVRLRDDIIFNYDKAEYYEKAEDILVELKNMFATLPENSKVIIEAHTDDKANDQDNLQLTKDRANLLLKRFADVKTLSHLTMTAVGVGEEMPIVPNDGNAENHQLNRRIDFIIQP